MIKFKLHRGYYKRGYTIGNFYYSTGDMWQHLCNTLEDEVRPTGQKVYGETAIASGLYKFIMTKSERFKKVLPLLLDVPNFTSVRIHTGNSNLDTSGCILLGNNTDKGKLTESTICFEKFMDLIEKNPQQEYELLID